MSSCTSEALWKHSTATASRRESAGNSSRAALRPSRRTTARNGRQRLPLRASHCRAIRSVSPPGGPSSSPVRRREPARPPPRESVQVEAVGLVVAGQVDDFPDPIEIDRHVCSRSAAAGWRCPGSPRLRCRGRPSPARTGNSRPRWRRSCRSAGSPSPWPSLRRPARHSPAARPLPADPGSSTGRTACRAGRTRRRGPDSGPRSRRHFGSSSSRRSNGTAAS